MKQSKTPQRRTSKRRHQELQVREYIERYHPEMSGSEVEISPCGTFASVRETKKTDQK
jgi:hypothetical protein